MHLKHGATYLTRGGSTTFKVYHNSNPPEYLKELAKTNCKNKEFIGLASIGWQNWDENGLICPGYENYYDLVECIDTGNQLLTLRRLVET